MQKILYFILIMLVPTTVEAQTQYGYVKTKGRFNADGQVIAGCRIPNATISFVKRDVISDNKGDFSFPTIGKAFMITNIQKNGYELYDIDQLKEYSYSSNPLVLVLEKPEDHEKDKLIAQQKISRTLRLQIQKREDEIERLKEEKKISEQEYQRRYNELYDQERKNQDLIKDMAERYAKMDFDQLDSINHKIQIHILNGELEQADSIINAKGSLEKRRQKYFALKNANEQEKQNLKERELNLEKSKNLEKKTLEELAQDYMNIHEICKLQCHFDSAAYYIESRASLDTLNPIWQLNAATYHQTQNNFISSEKFYLSSLNLLEKFSKSNSKAYEPYLVLAQTGLALLYSITQRFTDSEQLLKDAIELCARYDESIPMIYEPVLAGAELSLGLLYFETQRLTDSEAMYNAASEIFERLAKDNPDIFELEASLAMTSSAIGDLYSKTQRFADSEAMYKTALEIYERLSMEVPQVYEQMLAAAQICLGDLYSKTQRFIDSEAMYKAALEIYKRLAKMNPKAYESNLAGILSNMGMLYSKTQRYTDSEMMYTEALKIYRCLVKNSPKIYEPYLASTLNGLGCLYRDMQRFEDSKEMLTESLEINKHLAKNNPKAYEPYLAGTLKDFGNLYYDTHHLIDSEAMYKKSLNIYIRLSKTNPEVFEPNLAMTQNNLGNLYFSTKKFDECEAMYKAALDIRQRLAKDNPEVYEPDLALTYLKLSVISYKTNRLTESETLVKVSLGIYSHIILTNIKYESDYTKAQFQLFLIYVNLKEYSKAYRLGRELLLKLRKEYDCGNIDKLDFSQMISNLSFYSIILGKFQEGEVYANEAINVDSTMLMAYTNFAAALLFQGKFEQAEKIYRQYKDELKDEFLADFEEYTKQGVIPKERENDVERIKQILSE